MTNEERCRIFAAYWGAKVAYMQQYNDPYTLAGLTPYEVWIGGFSVGYDNCQLLLKPLNSISDEHAIEIYKMHNPYFSIKDLIEINNYEDGWRMSYSGEDFKMDIKIDCEKMEFEMIKWDEESGYTTTFNLQITDYLRNKGYNIGYAQYTPQQLIDLKIVKELQA